MPSSQFWISYSCAPPTEPKDVQHFYFKLYVSGKCIVSWGVGKKEHWCGKTHFALYDAGTDFEGKRVIEKRGLFFPKDGRAREGAGFEIRVFQAKARKREGVRYDIFKAEGGAEGPV